MRRDDANISVFAAVVTLALILVAGLVLDGGRVLAARRRAQDLAANAARVGAQALDEDRLRAGDAVLEPARSQEAVRQYLSGTGATGTAQVAANTVTVAVRLPVRMRLLSLAGISATTVSSIQQARTVQGVSTGE